jgi:hypothetical protein
MKKNSGASDLFIRQSNWVLTALKAPIGRIAEEPGPEDELLAGPGHAVHSVWVFRGEEGCVTAG